MHKFNVVGWITGIAFISFNVGFVLPQVGEIIECTDAWTYFDVFQVLIILLVPFLCGIIASANFNKETK